jgi:ABC-type molybdenum transport system ATPase subunit/photorepair protein PhrA
VETIAATGRTHLLYVSHRPEDMPACITHRLFLDAGRVVQR